jgi:hypothetical protein
MGAEAAKHAWLSNWQILVRQVRSECSQGGLVLGDQCRLQSRGELLGIRHVARRLTA